MYSTGWYHDDDKFAIYFFGQVLCHVTLSDTFNEEPEFRSESYTQSNINTYFPTRPCRSTVPKSQGKRRACDGNTACANTQTAECHYVHKRTHLPQIKHTTRTDNRSGERIIWASSRGGTGNVDQRMTVRKKLHPLSHVTKTETRTTGTGADQNRDTGSTFGPCLEVSLQTRQCEHLLTFAAGYLKLKDVWILKGFKWFRSCLTSWS